MPYSSIQDLPSQVSSLPPSAKKVWMNAYENAGPDIDNKFSYAWGAVKKTWKKTEKGWVKKAMTNTSQEKRMLLVAQKMRSMVKADVEKTAHPALLALVRALGPMIAKLGPKVLSFAKNLPPDMWADIAGNVAQMIGQGAQQVAQQAGGAGANQRSASVQEEKKRVAEVIAATAKRLDAHGVANSLPLAKVMVLSSLRAIASHKKNPQKKMADALRMIEEAKAEISIIREFF